MLYPIRVVTIRAIPGNYCTNVLYLLGCHTKNSITTKSNSSILIIDKPHERLGQVVTSSPAMRYGTQFYPSSQIITEALLKLSLQMLL